MMLYDSRWGFLVFLTSNYRVGGLTSQDSSAVGICASLKRQVGLLVLIRSYGHLKLSLLVVFLFGFPVPKGENPGEFPGKTGVITRKITNKPL